MRTDDRTLPAPVAVLSLVVGLLAMAVVSSQGAFGLRPALLAGQLALLAPFWLSSAQLRVPARDAFALRAMPPVHLLLSIGCGLGLWVASAGLLQVQYAVWPVPPHVLEFFEQLHAKLDLWPPWEGAFSLLAIAVGPALSEEIAFRGALLGSLRRWLGDVGAVFTSAALFALIHVPPGGYRVPFTFALGLALGALRLRTGSLLPAVIAHAVLNTATVIIADRLGDITAPTESASLAVGAAALAVGAAVAITFALPMTRRSAPQ